MDEILKKIKEFEDKFDGFYVRLVVLSNGAGYVNFEYKNRDGHFVHSFDSIGEFLQTEPNSVYATVSLAGWLE